MGTTATKIDDRRPAAHDQRLFVRRRLLEPIPIELLPGKQVWLHDLGEGGLSASADSRLALGTIASARFQLPEADSPIDAGGVVAWSDDSGRLGVRFTRVEPASAVALRRWLRNGAIAASESSVMNQSSDTELATRISCLSEVAELQSTISSEQFDCDAALDLIVKRMVELTRATGAAIALREGENVVCRARAGNAPDVGVKLSSTSLSGECFQSGAIVMLEDSESDPRVNPELCRQLNFRSLLVLPITSGTEIMGIAEVLSPNPRNFAGGDVLVLSFLNDLIANVAAPRIEADSSAVFEGIPLPDFDEPAPIEEAEDSDSLDWEFQSSVPVLSELPVESSVTVNSPLEASPALPELSEAPGSDIPRPVRQIALERASLTTRQPVLEVSFPRERTSISRFVLVAATLTILLAMAALLAGYYVSRSLGSKKAASTNLVSPPATPANNAAGPSALPISAAQVPATLVPARRVETKAPSAPTVRPSAPPLTAAAELQVTHGASQRPAVNADNVMPEAPALGAIDSHGVGALPTSIITAGTATPELQRAAASTGVIEGKLLRKVMPRYPEMARTAGVSGDVILLAKIGTDGVLHDIKVASGSPLLRQAAIDAARQWRYSPYKLGTIPVETETRITISFHR